VTSYDPPLRGIIDQNPVILEADVSLAEAARLQAAPCPKEDENPERRFVFIPKPDTSDENASKKGVPKGQEPASKEGEKLAPRPIERRRSRQDLPSLVTKVPRDIPPQFRRSTSAQGSTARDNDLTPRPQGPRTPGAAPGEYLLSPDVPRGKDYFGSVGTPRYREDSLGRNGTPVVEKRRSGGNVPAPYSAPAEKRNSGNFEKTRSRRNTNEKMTRPQQLSEEEYRRLERHGSTNSARLSTGSGDRHSGRSSSRSHRHHRSSDESDLADSDSDRGHRHRHRRENELKVEDNYRRSSSRPNNRSSVGLDPRYGKSPLPSPNVSPSQLPIRGLSPRGERERAETFPQRSGSRSPTSRPVSPFSPSEEAPRPFERLNPMDKPARSKSRQRQSHSVSTPTSSTQSLKTGTSLPIAIPSSSRPAEPNQLPSFPAYDESRAQPMRPVDSSPYWQPPPFQPGNLEKPVGTYRRYSEDIESGTIAPLPACPRTTYIRGRNDWLTLPGCESFDICPSCFNSSIAPTEFRDSFIPAPRRSPTEEVICDFGSSPWYRIAWLLTRKERRRDMGLFYGLAHVAASLPPCTGSHKDIRQWHSLVDPSSRTPISNFNVATAASEASKYCYHP